MRLSLIPSDVFISRRQELKTRTGCTDGRAGPSMGNKQGYQMPWRKQTQCISGAMQLVLAAPAYGLAGLLTAPVLATLLSLWPNRGQRQFKGGKSRFGVMAYITLSSAKVKHRRGDISGWNLTPWQIRVLIPEQCQATAFQVAVFMTLLHKLYLLPQRFYNPKPAPPAGDQMLKRWALSRTLHIQP